MPFRPRSPDYAQIAQAEDPDDSDYDNRASRPARSSRKRSKKDSGSSKRPLKRRRTGYGNDSDIEDDDDDIDEDEDSFGRSSSEEEVERNPLSGRPVRGITKHKKYNESSDEEEDVSEEEAENETDASEVEAEKKKKGTPKRTKIIKLRLRTPVVTAAATRPQRNTGSGSHAGKQTPTPTEPGFRPTRRSSRIAHDEQETMVALTNSGRHAEITRAGTRSPDTVAPRVTRGGKGLKKPASQITEEEGDTSSTKAEVTDNVLEIKASQHEVMESDPQAETDEIPRIVSDLQEAAQAEENDEEMVDQVGVPESENDQEGEGEDDEDDDNPVLARRKGKPSRQQKDVQVEEGSRSGRTLRRSLRERDKRQPQSSQRKGQEESSDFEPAAEEGAEDDLSDSEPSRSSPRKGSQRNKEDSESGSGKTRVRLRRGRSSRQSPESEEDIISVTELADIQKGRRTRRRQVTPQIVYEPSRRTKKPVNYSLLVPPAAAQIEEEAEEEPSATPSRREKRGGGGTWHRSLFSTYGPFGGAGGPAPVLGARGGAGAVGGADSDSSDDEIMQRPRPVGGTVGMTPTSAVPPSLFPPAQTHGADPLQGPSGTPANLGKVKDKQALADADPLGVDQNVSFDNVGGLEGHINSLKEMVALPLLYPEIFMRFHIVPPRGVLFHGPPGTGKTLLARALASSVSSQGRKVTFYMRKGADALSKWVGEAERQLRLLFEEARKNQPSIIFFDEIDGLAPVRSSKQEQIHASIVSTLLALMDGMDGRGQVIVIGATNRPDSVDPALRRPGRFDREFYFPLPNLEGRRAILNIHTKGWDPPLPEAVKDELAEITKGYGGADLRALCTEAALNAVQRQYPQIYSADEKLLIDPKKIQVTPRDFMISVKKMVPSSERSASSGASPLPAAIEPLLRGSLRELKTLLENVLPRTKQMTALEDAKFEQPSDTIGFRREKMQQNFELSRVFRPRLIVQGPQGFGQQYLAAAMLHHFEGLHVQSFDLPTLLSDATRTPEAAVIQLFSEVKMHKPSVIYIPNVQSWYSTVGSTVISTFTGLLRSIPPTDPVLLLGVLESDDYDKDDSGDFRSLFGFSRKNQYTIAQPDRASRYEFFNTLFEYVKSSPKDFPDPLNRKKRVLEILPRAPKEDPKPPKPPSKEELKAQKKRDRTTLNLLKIRLQAIMNEIKKAYKIFIRPVVSDETIRYLFEESDPTRVQSDQPLEVRNAAFRPYERSTDAHGEPGLREEASGKFFYNLEIITIEKRLSNGYYKRPRDFLADIQRLTKDAKTLGEHNRLMKANELLANCEVDIDTLEIEQPALVAECERVYTRELEREKIAIEKAKKRAEEEGTMPPPVVSNVPHNTGSVPSSANASTGPIVLGANSKLINGHMEAPATPSRPSQHNSNTNSNMTNGYAPGGGSDLDDPHPPERNGSSQADGDVQMENSDDHASTERETQHSSFGPSAQTRPIHSYTAPSQALRQASGLSAPLSQVETRTPMRPGSQAADYTNEASTTQTTSHPKTSDRSSGPQLLPNTQSSAGADGPKNLHQYAEERSRADGIIPDTQEDFPYSQISMPRGPSSQREPGYQPPPVPAFDSPARDSRPSISALLNNDEDSQPPSEPVLHIDHAWIDGMHGEVTDQTSGCSVEQLEQVNSAMMDRVWHLRGEWNRTKVGVQVKEIFNAVMKDIEDMQGFGPASWGRSG